MDFKGQVTKAQLPLQAEVTVCQTVYGACHIANMWLITFNFILHVCLRNLRLRMALEIRRKHLSSNEEAEIEADKLSSTAKMINVLGT